MRWLPISLIAVFIALLLGMAWKANRPKPVAPPPVAIDQPQAPAPVARVVGRPPPRQSPVDTHMLAAARAASRARIDKTVKAGRQRLQAQFTSERIDPSWAMPREQSLSASSTSPQIADLHVEPTNFQVQCRSSTCRVSADFPNRSSAEDWFSLFLTDSGTKLSKSSYQLSANPDGSAHLEIYGAAR
jgi:hypothetical protein